MKDQKITPFMWFDKETEEAINFYVDLFNGNPNKKKESKVVSIKRYPDKNLEGPMQGFEGKVLTGVFELEGQRFMALDGGPIFKPNESVSFLVDCADQTEIDYFWDRIISDGGMESQCGWCKDKYGFSWQIAPDMTKFMDDSDPQKFGRAMHEMLKMKKLDIGKLEEAYNS
jgi:predicted 3-demethylubiquinone-9 3-methyltransferase (glyoxalase superfamily)